MSRRALIGAVLSSSLFVACIACVVAAGVLFMTEEFLLAWLFTGLAVGVGLFREARGLSNE